MDVLLIVVFYLGELLDVAVGHPARRSNFAGLVDIDSGRKLYLQCSGRGSPTVVLVRGLRWVFIKGLSIQDGRLMVTSERENTCQVDVNTKEIT